MSGRVARRLAVGAAGIGLLVGAVAGGASAAELRSGPPTLQAAPQAALPHATNAADPDWLAEINRYRAATGLAAVSDQPSWDVGIQHHLAYLANTPASYMTGAYASAHTENPASPYYTPDGALEAGFSDLEQGGASTALDAVDEWLGAPFHAIGMLRAQLTQVALAHDSTTRDAGLDVIQGLDFSAPTATGPILFPGPGVTTNLSRFLGELPDPTETCGWQQLGSVGLPLIALLTQSPDPGLTASLAGPGGSESTAAGDLCLVDANTFVTSDTTYGPTGADILQADHAVILIPRRALTNGVYTATIQQPGQPDVSWSFSEEVPAPELRSAPQISGLATVGETLFGLRGSWSQTPTSYGHRWLRCSSTGDGCRAVPGETGGTHDVSRADVGSTLRFEEVAYGSGGASAPALSPSTAVVAPGAGSGGTTRGSVRVRAGLQYGRLAIRLPSWVRGATVAVATRRQRHACHRGGCHWTTVGYRLRLVRVTSTVMTVRVPRPTTVLRVRATVRVRPFTRLGVRWSSQPVVLMLGPLRRGRR
jgi:Cysteine-rich secretory protein family